MFSLLTTQNTCCSNLIVLISLMPLATFLLTAACVHLQLMGDDDLVMQDALAAVVDATGEGKHNFPPAVPS